MTHFITIAGPQSSGKTTALEYLRKKHPNWFFIEDINPYTVAGENHLGAAYTDKMLEAKILEIVLIKLKGIVNKYGQTSVAENGIFHLVFGQFLGEKDFIKEYIPKFIHLYHQLNSFIIFVDTLPEISYIRKKDYYLDKIRKSGITDDKQTAFMLKKYKDTIYKLYPYWRRLYDKLQMPKTIIDNSNLTKRQFLTRIESAINNLL